MIKLSMQLVGRPPDAAKIEKNLRFGVAKGLTKTAQDGQEAVVDALKGTFTLRGNWWQKSNKFGIKIRPATRDKLQSEVYTLADWLEKHETGGVKMPKGTHVSIPQWKIRPRGSTKKIMTQQRVKALLASGKAFVFESEKGPVVAREGRVGRLEILYGLERSVKIRKQSTFYEPINKVVRQRLNRNIKDGIAFALRTMR
jgi:hypothetical protein